jgi:hypothetical protein
MSGRTAAKLLDTPTAIWKTVTKAGGLDLKYHGDMDEDIIRSLLHALGADASKTLDSAISDPSLTVERFVGALLEALNPFSAMLSDLLAMFERAGATRTDHSLQIDFDFGNAPKLSFDLRQFRDWIEKVERVRELVRVRRWSSSDLWDLAGALRSSDNSRMDTRAERWTFEYSELQRWPEFDLPLPVSGDATLDEALAKCFNVWSMVVRETSKFGRDRRELHERARSVDESRDEGEGNWSLRFLANMDSNLWAGSVASGMHRAALKARSLPEADRRAFIDPRIQNIEELFARVPSMTIEEENIRRVLVEFLNLPIWQQRHELYSAWIITLIADALSDRELRFHLDNGLLSFSFGGSHIATADSTMPRLHVWTELRSPLQEPSRLSRRKSIQPDYTLVTDPMTSLNSAVVVVECKQYRRFSKKNFSHAVIDYAAGRPNAQIVLAAYGPVRDDFLKSLSPDVADRITLLGHLRPGDADTRERFRRAVRSAITNRLPASETEIPRIAVAQTDADALKSVKLSWRATPRDLDLFLGIWHGEEWAHICCGSHGNTAAFPWAQLDRDVRSGFGPETITVAKLLEATYRCSVRNFSHETPLAGSGAEIVIVQRDSEIRLICPRAGSGTFWHVFDFDARAQRLIIVNAIIEVEPTKAFPNPSH